jgi:hypothetical protein
MKTATRQGQKAVIDIIVLEREFHFFYEAVKHKLILEKALLYTIDFAS